MPDIAAPNPWGDEDLTAEEQKLFDAMIGGGEPAPTAAPEPKEPETEPAAPEASDKTAAAPEAKGAEKSEEPDEGITVDQDGRARNAQGRYVPHKALHAEREEHKKTKAELNDIREKMTRGDERLQMLLKAIEPEQAPAPAAPEPVKLINPNEDFLGALVQAQELLTKGQQTAQQSVQQLRAEQQEQAQVQRYVRDLQAAHAKDPQFADAMRHVMSVQDNLLQAQGVADPNARKQALFHAEKSFVTKAYTDKVNPAERLVALAKAYGWQPKAAAAPAANGNAPAANAQPAADPVADKLEAVQRGMSKAGATLSGGGGQTGETIETLRQLAEMDEDQFEAFSNKFAGNRREFERRYLGRD